MISAWTQHLGTENEKVEFEKSIYASRRVLDRLKSILDEQESALNIGEVSPKNYDSPSWAYKQAHGNGYRQCLNVLKKLVDLNQQLPRPTESNDERNTTRRARPPTADRPQ